MMKRNLFLIWLVMLAFCATAATTNVVSNMRTVIVDTNGVMVAPSYAELTLPALKVATAQTNLGRTASLRLYGNSNSYNSGILMSSSNSYMSGLIQLDSTYGGMKFYTRSTTGDLADSDLAMQISDGSVSIGTNLWAGRGNLHVLSGIGVGAAPSDSYGVTIYKTITDGDYRRGVYNRSTFNITTNGTIYNYGISSDLTTSYVNTGATNSGSWFGLASDAFISSTNHIGKLATMYGLRVQHGIYDCGTGGSIDNSYGVSVTGLRSDGTVGALWGFYESGNDANYFGSISQFNTNVYVNQTNYANYSRATNYLSSDGSAGCTMTFTNYTTGSGGSGIVTNVWVIKNGLVITNTITQ